MGFARSALQRQQIRSARESTDKERKSIGRGVLTDPHLAHSPRVIVFRFRVLYGSTFVRNTEYHDGIDPNVSFAVPQPPFISGEDEMQHVAHLL